MHAGKQTRQSQKGMALIMTSLTMLVTVPLVGLAIDVGILYMVRSRLYEATDAGALAGARALGFGATPSAQKTNALSEAAKYFNANFPANYWGTFNVTPQPPVIDDTSVPNYRSVSMSASVQVPLYFLRMLRQDSATVNVTSQAGRRDVVMMLVLDRSSSMNNPFQGQTACSIMKQNAAAFVAGFAAGRDMIGLAVFGATVFVAPPRLNFTSPDAQGNTIPSLIAQISCSGNTGTAQALNQAYAQLKNVNDSTRVNVVVLMTDGRPNGVTANFDALRINAGRCLAGQTGAIAQWAGGPRDTGNTAGVMNYLATSITQPNEGANANSGGCQYGPANSTANLQNLRNEISGMPAKDFYGNALAGPYSLSNPNSPYNGMPADLNTVSSPKQIIIASTNPADNQAGTIRSDADLKPEIYAIALEGNDPNDPPDTLFLRKAANDPTMENDPDPTARSYYAQQADQPHGYFVAAPDPSQLSAAFNSVATQIVVRLSR